MPGVRPPTSRCCVAGRCPPSDFDWQFKFNGKFASWSRLLGRLNPGLRLGPGSSRRLVPPITRSDLPAGLFPGSRQQALGQGGEDLGEIFVMFRRIFIGYHFFSFLGDAHRKWTQSSMSLVTVSLSYASVSKCFFFTSPFRFFWSIVTVSLPHAHAESGMSQSFETDSLCLCWCSVCRVSA